MIQLANGVKCGFLPMSYPLRIEKECDILILSLEFDDDNFKEWIKFVRHKQLIVFRNSKKLLKFREFCKENWYNIIK